MAADAQAGANEAQWLLTPAVALLPLDAARATDELEDITSVARQEGLSGLAGLLAKKGPFREFLAAVFDLSPFLRDLARRRPHMLDALLSESVNTRLDTITAGIEGLATFADTSEQRLMMELRRLKTEAHFIIALADLAGEADTETTVRRLSRLADACVQAAADFLLLDADRQGKLKLPDPTNPGHGSGWILLAMGKLGASELNFSSDIDLISFVDTQASAVLDPADGTDLFSRLTRRMVRILQDRTEHGYVFRTDLRLRPDPGSTPLAIPVGAALHYYEARGQNWERAAMIKARPVAGDIQAA